MLEEKLTAGILAKDTPNGLDQTNIVSEIAEAINKYNLDIILGPEWMLMPKERFYSKEEKDSLITKLIETTKDKDTLVMPGSMMWFDGSYFYNTTPVISKGNLLGEYYKHIDGGSSVNAYIRSYDKLKFGCGRGFDRRADQLCRGRPRG